MALTYWSADTSRHPLVVVHLVNAGPGSEPPNVDSLLSIVDGFIRNQEQIVVVYDLTGSKPDARRRQMLVTWLKRNKERLARHVLASAVVTPTPLHRGLMVATLWFVRPLRPLQVFSDRETAVSWAVEQLKRAGLGMALLTATGK